MKKKDILELKKRFKKDDCTFTKMCGCYVNGEKNIILNFRKTFLNLDEDEFFKYLEIAKKTLSGTVGNNLLELEFPMDQEEPGGKQYSLMELKRSALKNDSLLNDFYKTIIDNYDYTGNFLILLFHDAYDVITKTTDNGKLDESEEVYEYIICAICPVSLAKPGLAYFEDDNKIGARLRDWVVEPPAQGFVFPAFTDRSSDIHSVMYYTKNAKDSHPELMEYVLGCNSKQTAAEQKEVFSNIIRNAVGADEEKSDALLMEIQDNLNTMIDKHTTVNGKNSEPIELTNDTIQSLLVESGASEELTNKIQKSYEMEFNDEVPVAEYLIDKKILAAKEQKKKEQELKKKVEILQNKLDIVQQKVENSNNTTSENNIQEVNSVDDSKIDSSTNIENESSLVEDNSTETISNSHAEAAVDYEEKSENSVQDENTSNYDIVLKVKPQKVSQIKSQIIDGKKYLVIPMDDDEQANVNGIETQL